MTAGHDFPRGLIDGGPLALLLRAVHRRLEIAFRDWGTTVDYVPPRPTKADWSELSRRMPMVAVGWQSWSPSRDCGSLYQGDVQLPVFLMSRQSKREAQYFGDGTLPGILGMTALAVAVLHDWTIGKGSEFIGTFKVAHAAAAPDVDAIGSDIAFAALLVSMPNVGFDDPKLIAGLNDFLRLGETWNVDGDVTNPAVLNVRGA